MDGPTDRAPLREVYINGQDALLYGILFNFLKACDKLLWSSAQPDSFIMKTVGIQALFDVLRVLAPEAIKGGDATVKFFYQKLEPAVEVDFSAVEFRKASGSGRSLIRRKLLAAIGLN